MPRLAVAVVAAYAFALCTLAFALVSVTAPPE